MKVSAVVVTYNRIELLRENICSLLNQSISCDIILIDNNSSDGTEEYIKRLNDPRIQYYNMGQNLGGAGGFCRGIEIGESLGYDFLWIMDDDAVPLDDALESLLKKASALDYAFSFLASLVYWIDGKPLAMNIPRIAYKNKFDADVERISKYKVMPIQMASFVGCFINTKYSKVCGLPISEFFIYGDDVEYTGRLRNYANAYLDLDSIIIHKASSNQGADISTASDDRIDRFYYQSRNGVYIARKNGLVAVIKRLGGLAKACIYGFCRSWKEKFIMSFTISVPTENGGIQKSNFYQILFSKDSFCDCIRKQVYVCLLR